MDPVGFALVDAAITQLDSKWVAKASLDATQARIYIDACAHSDGKIYVTGGLTAGSYQLKLDQYDPATNTWTAKAAPLNNRAGLTLVSPGNGKLYALYGIHSTTYKYDAEQYDPVGNAWTLRATGLREKKMHGGAVVNGKAYCFGGDSSAGIGQSPITDEYDPVGNAWTAKAQLPANRGDGVAAAGVGSKAYVACGATGAALAAECWEYDPSANTFTAKTSAPFQVYQTKGVAAVGRFFVVGGFGSGSIPYSFVQEYNPSKNVWIMRGQMNQARNVHGVAAIGRTIYAMGGQGLSGAPMEAYTLPDFETAKAWLAAN